MNTRRLNTIDTMSQPLFSLDRKGISEVVISGVWTYKYGEQQHLGDQAQVVLRSLFKPWQFIALDVGDNSPLWALGMSSHSAQGFHLDAIESLCLKVGAKEQDLVCPRSYPMDVLRAALAKDRGESLSRFNHPCAGKHLVYVAACKKLGLSTDHYWVDHHPIHKLVTSFIGTQITEKPQWMVDSCGLPTLSLSTFELVNLWQKLASSPDPRYQRARQLMVENPSLIGGFKRLDSELIEKGQGKIIAKEGADGLLVVSSLPSQKEAAATCFLKIASGYNQTYMALSLWSVLAQRTDLPSGFRTIREFLRSRLETWVPSDQDLRLLIS